jgi:dihydroorotase
VGLETAYGLTQTVLVDGGVLSLPQAIAKLSWEPARIFRLPKGRLAVGADADVTVLDPGREWTVDLKRFASKSRNSPFHGWKLRGQVLATVVGGRVVWELEG